MLRQRDDVAPLSADESRPEALGQPEQEPAQHRPPEVTDPAEDGGRERLQAGDVAHEEVDNAVVETDNDARAGR
jgi:hypothetical protein